MRALSHWNRQRMANERTEKSVFPCFSKSVLRFDSPRKPFHCCVISKKYPAYSLCPFFLFYAVNANSTLCLFSLQCLSLSSISRPGFTSLEPLTCRASSSQTCRWTQRRPGQPYRGRARCRSSGSSASWSSTPSSESRTCLAEAFRAR